MPCCEGWSRGINNCSWCPSHKICGKTVRVEGADELRRTNYLRGIKKVRRV